MADRAFVGRFFIQPASVVGQFSLIAEVSFFRDTGEVFHTNGAFDFDFDATLGQIRSGIVENIRAVALDGGFDVSANNSILLPSLDKV